MQLLYVTCEKNANYLEYNFFQKRLICIVAGDKFTIKAMLCSTQYFYAFDSNM
jgi:hypothetical protein